MALTFKGNSKSKDNNEENPPTDRPTSNAVDSSFKLQSDRLRWSFEDPMHSYLKLQRIKDKEERVRELQQMLESSSSSSESDSDSSASSDQSHRKRKRRKHYSGSSSSSTDDSHRKKKRRKYSVPSVNTNSVNSKRKKKRRMKSSTDSDSSLDDSYRKQKKSEKDPIFSERKEIHKNDWKDACTKGKERNQESLGTSDNESLLKHRHTTDCDNCRTSHRKKKHKRRKSEHSNFTPEKGKHARDSSYTDTDRKKHTKQKHKKKKRKK